LKILILAIVSLVSVAAFSDSDIKRKNERTEDKKEFNWQIKSRSPFDVIPLNSPVKDSVAKFLLKVPNGFDIDDVRYKIRNASRLFDKDQHHQKINLIDGANGKELHVSVSKLPPGFYQLYVKVKDKKNKEHNYKNKYKDHAMFVIDKSVNVPMPDPNKNNATVAGIDSDTDGIRDDIQIWINEEFSTKPQVKMAMRQLAMSRQLDLTNVENKEKSVAAGKKYLDDLTCLRVIVGVDQKSKLSDDLNKKLLNTKDRLYADIKANANFSGQAWELPSTNEEKAALCSFNPDSF